MNKKIFGKALSVLALALCPTLGNALVVTINPDDYALGTDLSTISPYVDLQAVYNLERYAIVASASNSETATPGDLTFGSHAYLGCRRAPCGANDFDGFGMFFNQEVSNVSVEALNWGYTFGLPVSWAAFGQTGELISQGRSESLAVGDLTSVDIVGQGIWSVFVGGFSGIGAIDFNRVSFAVADPKSVPEPATLGLLGLGLAYVGIRTRKRV